MLTTERVARWAKVAHDRRRARSCDTEGLDHAIDSTPAMCGQSRTRQKRTH